MSRPRLTVSLSFFAAFCLLIDASAMSSGTETNAVFERFKDRVVQIQILEASSGAKASLGSGFLVSSEGHIVTNYHVISDLVHHPTEYRAQFVHHDGSIGNVTLLNFDAVHDLAIVQTDRQASSYFRFHLNPLGQGVRVFSLGTPLDLGFTIVEGTYSGLLADSLYENIHFTGSINPGMSGGPAILSNGSVVGVNVASAGNQVSFLVPAKFVKALLRTTEHRTPQGGSPGLKKLREQLLANQDAYMGKLLSDPLPTTVLGPYRLPGHIPGVMKCWGDSNRKKEYLYEIVSWECSAQNNLYISRSHRSGTLAFKHHLVSTDRLDRFRFFGLYQDFFQPNLFFEASLRGMRGDKEEVGPFRCMSDFVEHDTLTLKAVMCLRAYKKLPDLYDVVVKAATLDEVDQGVQTTLRLGGVSFDNATQFARHYLETIGRTHDRH